MIFQILGLSGRDMQIYLAALKLGSQPASVIARKAGLKRVNTYNHLKRLCETGVFRMYRRDGVTFFDTCEPERLGDLIKVKKSLIVEAEDGLRRIASTGI